MHRVYRRDHPTTPTLTMVLTAVEDAVIDRTDSTGNNPRRSRWPSVITHFPESSAQVPPPCPASSSSFWSIGLRPTIRESLESYLEAMPTPTFQHNWMKEPNESVFLLRKRATLVDRKSVV